MTQDRTLVTTMAVTCGAPGAGRIANPGPAGFARPEAARDEGCAEWGAGTPNMFLTSVNKPASSRLHIYFAFSAK